MESHENDTARIEHIINHSESAYIEGCAQFEKEMYREALNYFYLAAKDLNIMPWSYRFHALDIRSRILQMHLYLKDYTIANDFAYKTFIMTLHPDIFTQAKARTLSDYQVACACMLAQDQELLDATFAAEIAKELDDTCEIPTQIISYIQDFMKSQLAAGNILSFGGLERGPVNESGAAIECTICSKSIPFGNYFHVETCSHNFHQSCLQDCLSNPLLPRVGGDDVRAIHGMIHGFTTDEIREFRAEMEKRIEGMDFNLA